MSKAKTDDATGRISAIDQSGFPIQVPPVRLRHESEVHMPDVGSGISFVSTDVLPAFQWRVGDCTHCVGVRQIRFELNITQRQQTVYESGNVASDTSRHICDSFTTA